MNFIIITYFTLKFMFSFLFLYGLLMFQFFFFFFFGSPTLRHTLFSNNSCLSQKSSSPVSLAFNAQMALLNFGQIIYLKLLKCLFPYFHSTAKRCPVPLGVNHGVDIVSATYLKTRGHLPCVSQRWLNDKHQASFYCYV